MILEINPDAAIPPYEQVGQQITALVLGGALATGARLPAIRQLAKDLGLAGGTVARAYRELEADGVVTTHGRHGRHRRPPHHAGPPPELLDAARNYATRGVAHGRDPRFADRRPRRVRGGGRRVTAPLPH